MIYLFSLWKFEVVVQKIEFQITAKFFYLLICKQKIWTKFGPKLMFEVDIHDTRNLCLIIAVNGELHDQLRKRVDKGCTELLVKLCRKKQF